MTTSPTSYTAPTAPPAAVTTLTPALIGRWIAELGMSIRESYFPDATRIWIGPWDGLDEFERERLTEIGHDLLVRLVEAGIIAKTAPVAQVGRVLRDHRGRRLDAAHVEPVGGQYVPAAPSYTCGDVGRLQVIHQDGGRPCVTVEDLRAGLTREPTKP